MCEFSSATCSWKFQEQTQFGLSVHLCFVLAPCLTPRGGVTTILLPHCSPGGVALRSYGSRGVYLASSEQASEFTKMAGWSRVAAGLRSLLRIPRSMCSTQVRRAVVPALFGGSVGTGIFLYYQYRPNSRTLPFTVYAEEQKVSRRFIDLFDVDRTWWMRVTTAGSIVRMFSMKRLTKWMENMSAVVYREGRKHRSKVLIDSERPPAVTLWHATQCPSRTFTSCLFQEAAAPQLSARKVRFNQFASVLHEQEPYMTPRDFLYSVMLEKVDRKIVSPCCGSVSYMQMMAIRCLHCRRWFPSHPCDVGICAIKQNRQEIKRFQRAEILS